jgi:DNA-binding cell septation regulator SpoVG
MRKVKTSQKEIITEIEFFPILPKNGVICFCSFTYKNSLRIQDCAILTRPTGGYRLSFPIKKLTNGKTIQAVYPINKKLGTQIEEILLVNFEDFLLRKAKE